MKKFGWGVDGYDRQHICKEGCNIIIFCVIPGCSVWDCIELLENQL